MGGVLVWGGCLWLVVFGLGVGRNVDVVGVFGIDWDWLCVRCWVFCWYWLIGVWVVCLVMDLVLFVGCWSFGVGLCGLGCLLWFGVIVLGVIGCCVDFGVIVVGVGVVLVIVWIVGFVWWFVVEWMVDFGDCLWWWVVECWLGFCWVDCMVWVVVLFWWFDVLCFVLYVVGRVWCVVVYVGVGIVLGMLVVGFDCCGLWGFGWVVLLFWFWCFWMLGWWCMFVCWYCVLGVGWVGLVGMVGGFMVLMFIVWMSVMGV